jgi:quercetin 2,3-dioxygenase
VSVRVVAGEISAQDATTRKVIPNANFPRWPPFDRVAETIATPRRAFPPHRHEGVEVLTYIIEGSGTYALGTGPADPVSPGSVRLLTAPTSTAHSINPGKGKMVRWFSVISRLPGGSGGGPQLQSGTIAPSGVQPDGTILWRLVGPTTPIRSALGVECEAIKFQEAGDAYRKVGHDRVAVCYAISGRGSVDSEGFEGGEAALVEDAAGLALHGRAGLHVVLVTGPHPRPGPEHPG